METFSALLAICGGNSPVPGEFPAQKPVTRSFDVFFDMHLNKRLSKQWRVWWFETPLGPLWRHCNDFETGPLLVSVSSLYHGVHSRCTNSFSGIFQNGKGVLPNQRRNTYFYRKLSLEGQEKHTPEDFFRKHQQTASVSMWNLRRDALTACLRARRSHQHHG